MDLLVRALTDGRPPVRSHAAWALGQVGKEAARGALPGRLVLEERDRVREKIEAFLPAGG